MIERVLASFTDRSIKSGNMYLLLRKPEYRKALRLLDVDR